MRLSDKSVYQAVEAIGNGPSPIRLMQDRGFFSRVFTTPHSVYRERLQFAGMTGHDRVLDAGCGFGQWTLALAETNRHIHALDLDVSRVGVLTRLGSLLNIESVSTSAGRLDQLPFADSSFDAVFCYSVVNWGDWRRGTSELVRVAKPGGAIYVSANALGWYIYNLVEGHNDAEGPIGSPRQMAWDTIRHTLGSHLGMPIKPGRLSIISPRALATQLEGCGARVEQIAGDGRAGSSGMTKPKTFFEPKKYGLHSVFEILATKL